MYARRRSASPDEGLATDGGEEYVAAVKACVDVISEQIAPEQFREALLRAADEAGIAALTVVH